MLGTKLSTGRSGPGPDGPHGPRLCAGRFARAEQIRVPNFLLCLLTKITELARRFVCKGSSPPRL
jgi:hypothetical protein